MVKIPQFTHFFSDLVNTFRNMNELLLLLLVFPCQLGQSGHLDLYCQIILDDQKEDGGTKNKEKDKKGRQKPWNLELPHPVGVIGNQKYVYLSQSQLIFSSGGGTEKGDIVPFANIIACGVSSDFVLLSLLKPFSS